MLYVRSGNQVKIIYLAKHMRAANTDHTTGKVPTYTSVLECHSETRKCVRECYVVKDFSHF